MVTVRTKQELEVAMKNKAASIRIEGPYAKTFANAVRSRRRKAKVAKGAIGFGALAVIGGFSCRSVYRRCFFSGNCYGCNSYGTYRWYCNYKYCRIGYDTWFCNLRSQPEV